MQHCPLVLFNAGADLDCTSADANRIAQIHNFTVCIDAKTLDGAQQSLTGVIFLQASG